MWQSIADATRIVFMNYFGWMVLTFWMLVLVFLAWHKKLPSVETVQDFVNILATMGGNIVVLLGLTMMFFASAVRMFYWTMDKIVDGKISADNAIILAGWAFVTGSGFGGSSSALYKAMTGRDPTRKSDRVTDGGSNGNSPKAGDGGEAPAGQPQEPATATAAADGQGKG